MLAAHNRGVKGCHFNDPEGSAVYPALAGLPLRMGTVLVLRSVDQLADAEIAGLVGGMAR